MTVVPEFDSVGIFEKNAAKLNVSTEELTRRIHEFASVFAQSKNAGQVVEKPSDPSQVETVIYQAGQSH